MNTIEGLDILIPVISRPSEILLGYIGVDLALADSEHFGAAYRTRALGRWPAILHDYRPGVFNLPFGLAFHTITLHAILLTVFVLRLNYLTRPSQVGSYPFRDKKRDNPSDYPVRKNVCQRKTKKGMFVHPQSSQYHSLLTFSFEES